MDNPPAWLFTVARRLVGRAQAGQRRVAVGDAHEHVDGDRTRWTSLSRRASLEAMTEARTVMDAVAASPSRQRAATYLRHVQGLSLGEIAV